MARGSMATVSGVCSSAKTASARPVTPRHGIRRRRVVLCGLDDDGVQLPACHNARLVKVRLLRTQGGRFLSPVSRGAPLGTHLACLACTSTQNCKTHVSRCSVLVSISTNTHS